MDIRQQEIPDTNVVRRPIVDNAYVRSIVVWTILGATCLGFAIHLGEPNPWGGEKTVAFSDFLDQVESGAVSEVLIQGDVIHYRTAKPDRLRTYSPTDSDLIEALRHKSVKIVAGADDTEPGWLLVATQLLPLFLLVGIWIGYNEQRLAVARG